MVIGEDVWKGFINKVILQFRFEGNVYIWEERRNSEEDIVVGVE